jgi:hypothetical protein
MSRRRDRGRRPESAASKPAGGASSGGGQPDRGRAGGMGLPAQLALLAAVFAVTVGVAELAGAANLGVSFGIGQVVFTAVLLVLLIRE